MAEEIFDFGFTAMDESELEVVQQASVSEEKLTKLYSAIIPLLNNLKKNPEKDYIYWPDRVSKVQAFEKMITKIVKD